MNQDDLESSEALVDNNKYREALDQLELFHKVNTGTIDKQVLAKFNFLTAICLHKLRSDFKRALGHYNLALENGFNEFWVKFNRGMLFLQLGELESAINDLTRAVELEPSDKKANSKLKEIISHTKNNLEHKFKLNSPVIVLSVGKSGTMLLASILSEIFGADQVIPSKIFNIGLIDANYIKAIPELKNMIYVGHLLHSEDFANRLSKFPKIILLRDPRDQVVSLAHFVDKMKKDFFGDEERFWDNLETFENKISAAILGMVCKEPKHHLTSVYDTFWNYGLKWMGPRSIIITFRDIAGSQFGGNDLDTFNTISKIMNHIGIFIDDNTLREKITIGSKPSNSPTFRSGKIGTWKDEFNESHVIQMKTVAPNLISTLGFESNENWGLESENTLHIPPSINEENIKNLEHIDKISDKYCILQTTVNNDTQLQYLIDSWAYKNLVQRGEYENVLPIISNLLKLMPYHPELNYFYGFCLHTIRGDFQNALNHYNLALENGFNEFWVKFNRGTLFLQLGERESAINDLTRAVELDPKHEGARSTLELAILKPTNN